MALSYPSIPDPTLDPKSLRDSVLALKQLANILTGQVNPTGGAAAATSSGLNATNSTVASHGTTLTSQAAQIAALQANSFIRGALAGLKLSAAGGVSTFGVAAGSCADSTNVAVMNLASAYTKTTAAWAVGSGNGALDTGTIANSTWYHVHVIQRVADGVTDVLVSLSATSPTMPSGWTPARRIGSMKTDGSAHWITFTQNGDEFLWLTSVTDVNGLTTLGTTPTNFTLTVPTGLNVHALCNCFGGNSAAATEFLFYPPDIGTQAAVTPVGNWNIQNGSAALTGVAVLSIRTNTSAQIAAVGASAANNTIYVNTKGWIDRRGRDA